MMAKINFRCCCWNTKKFNLKFTASNVVFTVLLNASVLDVKSLRQTRRDMWAKNLTMLIFEEKTSPVYHTYLRF